MPGLISLQLKPVRNPVTDPVIQLRGSCGRPAVEQVIPVGIKRKMFCQFQFHIYFMQYPVVNKITVQWLVKQCANDFCCFRKLRRKGEIAAAAYLPVIDHRNRLFFSYSYMAAVAAYSETFFTNQFKAWSRSCKKAQSDTVNSILLQLCKHFPPQPFVQLIIIAHVVEETIIKRLSIAFKEIIINQK